MILYSFVALYILFCDLHLSNAGSNNQISSHHSLSLRRKRESIRPDYSEYPDYDGKIHHRHRIGWGSNLEKHAGAQQTKQSKASNAKLQLVPNWPDPSKSLGQLSAVSIDGNGNVVVFHRGDRTWNIQTFSGNNMYAEKHLGPIQQNTIVVFNITTGLVVEEWGSDLFYLPHGLTVDSENNIWLTDVALHQVFKFSADRSKGKPAKPSLTLGTAFVPGNDDNHFCKPTDVAVLSNGDFFVSDGYCNARIVKYDKNGRKLMQWGRNTISVGRAIGQKPPPDHFLIPHGLAAAEEKQLLFVADRENGRVQCFNTTSGVFIRQLHADVMGPRIFSVAYAPVNGGLLYIVNGPAPGVKVGGFVASLTSLEFVAYFNSDGQGLQSPHDVAVTKDGSQVFVVELNPFKVWKFIKGNITTTTPTKPMNMSVSNNTTKLSQTPSNLKLSTEAGKQAKDAADSQPEPGTGSVVAAIVIIISMILVIIIVVIVVIARIRRAGCFTRYTTHASRWDFRLSTTDGFKFRKFLDRHQGFEKVSTEESDDEGSTASLNELQPHPQHNQCA